MFQYLPWLEAAGIELTWAPLFSNAYVTGLQLNSRNPSDVVQAYAKRINALLDSSTFDLVWLEKDALPWLPAWIEQALLSRKVPYVLDYDDAVFHSYDLHRNPLVKRLLAGKHPALMRASSLVMAGNNYLAEFALQTGASRVELMPTVVDMARYPSHGHVSRIAKLEPPCVGWIGQRSTASFLMPFKAIFERFSGSGQASFAAIGIDAQALDLPMESITWTEQTEVESIARFDIGIMPLLDAHFERGKCGYKLIQYMACGLPVVASPVGVNCQIVEHGVNGFLAKTPEQWEKALQTLLSDAGLRQRMGAAGRCKVEQQYSIQVTGPKLASLLIKAARA
jgi:hypothetical protein